MGALVGLGVGVGLLLIWAAFALPRRPQAAAAHHHARSVACSAAPGSATSRSASVVRSAPCCSPWPSPSCRPCSRTLPVAFVFAAMAAYLPVAVLRQRAARRLRDFAEVWPEAVDNLASAVRAGLSLPDAVAALGTTRPRGAAARRSPGSRSTTRSPAGSASASTASRSGSPTRSGTA